MDTTRPSLLVRLKDHADENAWLVFDEIYRPMLHRFALARGLRHADAEDVVQQCMSAISDHIGAFEYDPQKGRFKSWLRTVVNNKVGHFLRTQREQRADSGDLQNLESPEAAPEDVFDRLWMQEHLWHCLRQLQGQVDEATFKAFQLYVIDERPIEEVCAELNLKPNNVYTIKWRITEKIAEKMSELLGETE